MFDPVSISVAISVGTKAFSLLKQGIAAGRELQDMAGQLSEWGKAELKEAIVVWTLGTLIVLSGIIGAVTVFWFIGHSQGKW